MRLLVLQLHCFRGYDRCRLEFGEGLHVIHGANAAGKTNLLEAIYLACTGRSCRTTHERRAIAFGAEQATVRLTVDDAGVRRVFAVTLSHARPKQMTVDGSPVESLLAHSGRPLASVFLPDRLALIKGPPALRRAHLDQLVAALWPGRAQNRRTYASALAQRNALLVRIRAGATTRQSIASWDLQVARAGAALIADRTAALELVSAPSRLLAQRLGLQGELRLRYRTGSAADFEALACELAGRFEADLERGFTAYGPHRDDLVFERDGREVRSYASQGEQRLALLALLLAERQVVAQQRGIAPLMLLDDVMSELDSARREALVELLCSHAGQTFIATADPGQVPLAPARTATSIAVRSGLALTEARAA